VFDNRQEEALAGPDQSICIPTFPNTVTLNGLQGHLLATGRSLVKGRVPLPLEQ
jgi:hypothetical protein